MASDQTDSIISAKERSAKIRAEAIQRERELAEADRLKAEYALKQEAETRRVQDADIARATSIISSDTTRDELLERIREMREEKPAAPPPPPPRSEGQMKEFLAEQEAGRAAVAKAEAEAAHNRAAREKALAEEAAKLGSMAPVHHPNPGQGEVYPVTGGTLGKRK